MHDMSFDGKSARNYWALELVKCYISTPKRKQHLLDVPGGDGQIDTMRGLGDPSYEMRTLTVVCRSTESNTRDTIDRILNELVGREVEIIAPDKPNHYMVGEVKMQGAGYRSGAQITLVASVFPWRYARNEIVHTVPAAETALAHVWRNAGSRPVVPELTVHDKNVVISTGGKTFDLPQGTYDLSEIKIPGKSTITVSVSGGTLTARYREAIL